VSSKHKEYLVQVLDEIAGIQELRDIHEAEAEFTRLRERLADDEFRIAVVGEFSSGKSTFINAMLGRDILARYNRNHRSHHSHRQCAGQ